MKTILTALAIVSMAISTTTAQDSANKRKCSVPFNNGKPCTHYAVANGLCRMHDPATPKCAGKKADGTKCKVSVKTQGQYCHNHKPTTK